jgi:hypothetical protein
MAIPPTATGHSPTRSSPGCSSIDIEQADAYG